MVHYTRARSSRDPREVDVRLRDEVEVVREHVERDVGDDLDDLRVAVAGLPDRRERRVGHLAALHDHRLRELEAGLTLGPGGARDPAPGDRIGIQPGARAEHAVSRQAVLAGVHLRDRERDLLAERRIEHAGLERRVQLQEPFERGGCHRHGLDQVRGDSEVCLHGIEQQPRLAGRLRRIDCVDSSHSRLPVMTPSWRRGGSSHAPRQPLARDISQDDEDLSIGGRSGRFTNREVS